MQTNAAGIEFRDRTADRSRQHVGQPRRVHNYPEIERTGRHDLLGRRDRECAAALHIVADLALVRRERGVVIRHVSGELSRQDISTDDRQAGAATDGGSRAVSPTNVTRPRDQVSSRSGVIESK
jgi:hypothetical protein